MSRRRSSGPAADAGCAARRQSPASVATSRPATRSSIFPTPVERCPAERVATQPPTLENSNDCGSWPRRSPCGVSAASSSGPSVPARSARQLRGRIDRDHAAQPLQRQHHDRAVARGHGHAARDAGAAAARDDRHAAGRRGAQQLDDLFRRVRRADGVGVGRDRAGAQRDEVGQRAAAGGAQPRGAVRRDRQRQRRERARRRKRDLGLGEHRQGIAGTEPLGQKRARRLGNRESFPRDPPPVPPPLALGHHLRS